MRNSSSGFSIPIVISWGDNMENIKLFRYAGTIARMTKTGFLYDETPINNPIYRCEIDFHAPVFDVENDLSPALNYCEISQGVHTWYYFCTIENIRRGLSRVTCKIDVLSSYYTGIMNTKVWCHRSAAKQTPYITDGRAPIETRKLVSATPLQEISAHSTDMIIITVG